MAGPAARVASPEFENSSDQNQSAERPAVETLALGASGQGPIAGKDPRALQAMITQAFALLEEAADRPDDVAAPGALAKPPGGPRRLGAAAGSELRHTPSIASRALKTLAGLAIVVVVGVVPYQRLTALVSGEAYVDAPVYLVRAPADGIIRTGQLSVGALVARDVPLALIESPAGSAGDAAVVSTGDGKVWDVRVQPGDRVAKGDLIARVVGCSATSVVASVSESVYDRLQPGVPARFNFFGSDRFFTGKVANLLGGAGAGGDYAIAPFGLGGGAYRVAVALPDLGKVENCAVGRRGIVVFSPSAH
jgi:hypothetical protein